MREYAYCALDHGHPCRSCGVVLRDTEVGNDLVCLYCETDCRCPPEGEEASDPIAHLDACYADLTCNRQWVASELRHVPWPDGGTVGYCPAYHAGQRCELPRNHRHRLLGGLHRAAGLEWR